MSIIKDHIQTNPKTKKHTLLKRTVATLAICASIAASTLGLVGCVDPTPVDPNATPGTSVTQPLPTQGQSGQYQRDTINLVDVMSQDSSFQYTGGDLGDYFEETLKKVADDKYKSLGLIPSRNPYQDEASVFDNVRYTVTPDGKGILEANLSIYVKNLETNVDILHITPVAIQLKANNSALLERYIIDGDYAKALECSLHLLDNAKLDQTKTIKMTQEILEIHLAGLSNVSGILDCWTNLGVADKLASSERSMVYDNKMYCAFDTTEGQLLIPLSYDTTKTGDVITSLDDVMFDFDNASLTSNLFDGYKLSHYQDFTK